MKVFDTMIRVPRHYQHPICTALLVVKPGEYADLRIKAHAGRVLVAFLQERVAQLLGSFARNERPEKLVLIHATLSAICLWCLRLEQLPRYLSPVEAEEMWQLSQRCLA